MEINELNYETYALDYAEGTLSGQELAAMETFLSLHPELAEEIGLIAGTTVPHEAVVFTDKQALKQKKRPVAFLPIAFALSSAASLVLALGLIWLIGQRQYYGELALIESRSIDMEPSSGDEAADLIVFGSEHVLQRGVAGNTTSYMINNQVGVQSRSFTAGNFTDDREEEVEDLKLNEQETSTAISSPEPSGQIEFNNLVNLKDDVEYVIPVTLELHDLAEKGALQMKSELNADLELEEEKMARRQFIKDGALSMIQQKLLPSGVVDLFSN